MSIPFIRTNSGAISAFVGGKAINVPPDHRFYKEILEAIRAGDKEEFIKFADLGNSIEKYAATAVGNSLASYLLVTVAGGMVYYKGQVIHNAVAERIIQFMAENLPAEPLILFLENLMQNSSRHSVEQLYRFLENQKLPITEDGCFLGYKRVKDDWFDFHSGTIDNSIGKVIEIERNLVDDDFSHDCSYGLHVGSIDYVRGFNSGGHVLVVKVNPRDAVAVPAEDHTKIRVCRYEVLEEADPELLGLDKACYSAGLNTPVTPSFARDDEDDDDDYEDDYEDDDCCPECGCEECHCDDDDCDDEEYYDDDDHFEDEDEDEESIVPRTLVAWANDNDIDPNYFVENNKIRNAVANKDGVSVLQYLYGYAMDAGDSVLQDILENPTKKTELIKLVQEL